MKELLKALCEVHSPSGEEVAMKNFILNYIDESIGGWKNKPQIIHGEDFQDCLILVFGKPRVAAFAHMDSTGFTVRYQDQLVPIGGPEVRGDEILSGKDTLGEVECNLTLNNEGQLHYNFGRAIASGTSLVYSSNFTEEASYIKTPYLDNRLGIYNLLKIAETLENGALVFSSWEENGGGSVPFLVKYLYEKYSINKMLVSDVTWASDGVELNKGVVISCRDKNIPRKSFVDLIVEVANRNNVLYQIEVEAYGSSDAREIQLSQYPIDWCFIGPPVENVHTSQEIIHKNDLGSMVNFYEILMSQL